MKFRRFVRAAALAICLTLLDQAIAADAAPTVVAAHGTIDKVEKDSITVRTRQTDGKFGKSLTLKITGTTNISTVSMQMRSGKPVLVQRKTEAKDLEPKQAIALVYATAGADSVLLAAVLEPSEK